MVKYVLKRTFYSGHIAFDLPASDGAREAIRRVLERCRDRHGDYVLVTLEPPKRSRTTGEGSQNHHLNGHIMQICGETGNDYDAVKNAVKQIAVEQMGYPYHEIAGRTVPIGEHESSTDECAKLIEAAHVLAADFGIILQE